MKKIITGILLILSVHSAQGQDIHFSQHYAMPVFQNPAFTGYIFGDMRAATNFRMQWESFGEGFGNAFRTGAFAADIALLRNSSGGGSTLGMGLTFLNDRAGDLKLSTNQLGWSLSYIQAVDRQSSHFLAAGFHGTYNQRTLDLSRAVFPDLAEPDILTKRQYLNVSAGVLWYFQPNPSVSMYLGGAMHNVTQPNVSFLEEGIELMDRRYNIHFGAMFSVNRNVSLVPSVLFQKKGPAEELILGSFFRYYFSGYNVLDNTNMQLGLFYRFNDALIPVARLEVEGFSFIFSYDLNISSLAKASYGQGGAEISIIWTGWVFSKSPKFNTIKCPSI